MCEPTTPARDLSPRLMRLCDENLGYLRGAVAAADAICDLLFDQAEENGAVYSTNRGLRWALEEAEAAVEELSKDLHTAHRLALEQAGGAPPPTT
jgi:hypothetical protein